MAKEKVKKVEITITNIQEKVLKHFYDTLAEGIDDIVTKNVIKLCSLLISQNPDNIYDVYKLSNDKIIKLVSEMDLPSLTSTKKMEEQTNNTN